MISFIVPCSEKDIEILRTCIRGLLQKPMGEIVVVLRGTDAYVESALSVLPKNVVAIRNFDPVFNKAKMVNQGVRASTGDHVCVWDVDLVPGRDAFQMAEKILGKGYLGFMCFNQVRLKPSDGKPSDDLDEFIRRVTASRPALIVPKIKRDCSSWYAYSIMLLPKTAFMEARGMCEEYHGWGFEDTDFYYQMLARGLEELSVGGSASVFHVFHTGNRSYANDNKGLFEKRKLIFARGGAIGNVSDDWGTGSVPLQKDMK